MPACIRLPGQMKTFGGGGGVGEGNCIDVGGGAGSDRVLSALLHGRTAPFHTSST